VSQSRSSASLPMGDDAANDEQEQAHFRRVVHAFRYYHTHASMQIDRIEANMSSLRPDEWARLPAASRLEVRIPAMRSAATANAQLLDAVSSQAVFAHDEGSSTLAAQDGEEASDGSMDSRLPPPNEFNMGKVRSTLRQFVREWSAEGAAERNASFGVLLEELQARLPLASAGCPRARVLVPGAGLGRLCYEVAMRGYEAQGNEWSYFMLLGSSFILNRHEDLPSFDIQPWVHQQSNCFSVSDQLRVVSVPDVVPTRDPPPPGSLSMCAGDFVSVGSLAGIARPHCASLTLVCSSCVLVLPCIG
jgi:carnosine N-methyltransferase